MQSAYTECNEWLTQVLIYIEENARFAREFIEQHIPALSVIQSEGTFTVDRLLTPKSFSERTNKKLEEKGKSSSILEKNTVLVENIIFV